MGSFYGADIFKLVGIYDLHQLKNLIRKENAGLYRDDGLSILRNLLDQEVERVRKRMIRSLMTLDQTLQAK